MIIKTQLTQYNIPQVHHNEQLFNVTCLISIKSAINENITSDNNLMFATQNSIFNRCRRGRNFLGIILL